MNVFEIGKIIGAVAGAVLLVMGIGYLADAIYTPIENRGQGYNLPDGTQVEAAMTQETEVEPVSLATLLASASAEEGARVARKCQACHNFDEGGANKTGPDLYNIVGSTVAANATFKYSDTLVQMGSEGQVWTYENLDSFLQSPRTFAPGTKMTFSGLRKEEDRANLLAYLRTLSASPVDFPTEGEEAPAGTETAAAEETAPENTAETAASEEAATSEEAAASDEAAASEEGTAAAGGDAASAAAQDSASATTQETAPVTEEATSEESASAAETTAPAATEESAPAATTTEEAAPAATATEETTSSAQDEASATQDEAATQTASAAGSGTSEIAALLAMGDAGNGERVSRKCKACHNFEAGAGNKTGPDLYDIVNRPIADVQDFRYSSVLTEMGEAGEVWTFENLNAFLAKPRDFAPRTKMAFAGLRKDQDRADLLAYLRTLSENPAELPQ